jgi:hypothetical protein
VAAVESILPHLTVDAVLELADGAGEPVVLHAQVSPASSGRGVDVLVPVPAADPRTSTGACGVTICSVVFAPRPIPSAAGLFTGLSVPVVDAARALMLRPECAYGPSSASIAVDGTVFVSASKSSDVRSKYERCVTGREGACGRRSSTLIGRLGCGASQSSKEGYRVKVLYKGFPGVPLEYSESQLRFSYFYNSTVLLGQVNLLSAR